MKVHQLIGLAVSTVLHAGLALLLLPFLWASEQKPVEPEPLVLEMSRFEPLLMSKPLIAAASSTPVPVAEARPESSTVAHTPVVEPKSEPPPLPKKEKQAERPKPKQAPKPEPVAIKPTKQLKPRAEPKTVVEQSLSESKPDVELLQKQAQERLRLAALREQRQREFVERQQQEQERQRLEQYKQQEQAKRRAEWEQAQQGEVARQQQAIAKAKAEQQRASAAQVATKAAVLPAKASPNAESALPLLNNPRYRTRPSPPEYPRRALEAGIEGTVLIRVTLSAEGSILRASVHQSSGHASLDAAALKAVGSWSFMPAERDGKTIPSIVQLPVRFKLN